MLKKALFLILVSAGLLFCADLGQLISGYEKSFTSSDRQKILKSYQGFKNIYIKSLIKDDIDMQKRSLKGIIKSAKILGKEYKDYEKELKILDSSYKSKPHESLIKKVKKPVKKTASKEQKKVISGSIPRIRYVGSKNNQIRIRFDKDIDKSFVKNFNISRKKQFLDIYDIKAVLPFKNVSKRTGNGVYFKVAQNKKNLVRLVLDSSSKISTSYKVDGEFLLVDVGSSGNYKKSYKPTASKSIAMVNKKIVIDAGHGGKDAGAVGSKKRYEKRGVLSIAKRLYNELKSRGYQVYMTRDRDKFIRLRDRTKFANGKKADVFVSLHMNAAAKSSKSLKGIETYFLSPARSSRAKRVAAKENKIETEDMNYFSKQTYLNFLNREKIVISNKLAIDIQKNTLSYIRKRYSGVRDGGVREAPFWVLVGAQMPSVLIELGYLTNPTEIGRLFNSKYQRDLAIGIANGIDSFFAKNM